MGDVTMGACFRYFGQIYLALGAITTSLFSSNCFWKL